MARLPIQRVGSARILVVDDEEDARDLVATVLGEMGYAVDTTRDGRSALRQLEQAHYDLMVSDLRMPELDGPGLYREVLRRWPNDHPSVLFVSGFGDTPDYAGFLNRTHVPVLLKPFTVDHLRQTVERVLEGA